MSSISLKLGYKYLRSNKGGSLSFTTLLAVIGLMIGISSLIVVTSVMNGFEKELQNRIFGVVRHAVIYSDDPINNSESLITLIKENKAIFQASGFTNFEIKIFEMRHNEGKKDLEKYVFVIKSKCEGDSRSYLQCFFVYLLFTGWSGSQSTNGLDLV